MRLYVSTYLYLALELAVFATAYPSADPNDARVNGPPGRPGHGPPWSSTGPAGSGGTSAPDSFRQLEKTYVKNTIESLKAAGCTREKITIRKAWDDLSVAQRKDYTRAVNCLAAKPNRVSNAMAPGARNRLDDFTWNHINQTNIIHFDAYLLPWHRVFVWQMEQALRNECGYQGYMPYWDTGRHADNITQSPLFDGSDSSMGGDGKYIPNRQSFFGILPGLVQNISLPRDPGSGGGCITSGPFINYTISLGPVFVPHINQSNVYGYEPNPRCLSRDFSQLTSTGNLTWAHVTELVQQTSIANFRNYLEQWLHGNGHITIGGEGADPFSTTNDPAFYLLHAQIDRLWAIWQGQDIAGRTNLLDGTRTFFGIPLASAPDVPPANGTLEDIIDFGVNGKLKVKNAMSPTLDGRCYLYL